MNKGINNIKDYLDQLVWEYGQACQRPRGDLYFIASGKQCRQGKPVSEAAVQAIREKKRKESLSGKKSDKSTDPSIGGKIGGVWDALGTKAPKYPYPEQKIDGDIGWRDRKPTNATSLYDKLFPEQRDKIKRSLVDFLRDKEYDPEGRKFVPKKSKVLPIKDQVEQRKKELEEARKKTWAQERDLRKLLTKRGDLGWKIADFENASLSGSTNEMVTLDSKQTKNKYDKLMDKLSDINRERSLSGKEGKLSEKEEELLRDFIISGVVSNFERRMINTYIVGRDYTPNNRPSPQLYY